MVKDRRFLPVESHEPVEEDFEDTDSELSDDSPVPRRKGLYIAS